MNAKILVVDDIDSNLLLVEKSLAGLDAEIKTSQRPLQAIEMAKEEEFALFILDVQMPQMIGFELADELRKTSWHRITPIIFITGIYSDIDSMYKGYQSGAVDYLTKPFNRRILYNKVNFFLEFYKSRKELADKTRVLQDNNRKLSEANLRERTNKEHFRLLSKVASEFQELEASENIYRFIGEKLSEIYPDCLIFLSSFDEKTRMLSQEYQVDPRKELKRATDIIGKNVSELIFKMDEEAYQSALKGELQKVEDLCQLTIHQLPEKLCDRISRELGINRIYSSGFAWNERLYGTVSFLFTGNDKIHDYDFTQAFIRQASMSIQRWIKDRSLRASEARYRKLFESMSQGIIYQTPDGVIVDANPAAEKILGLTRDELMGRTSMDPRWKTIDEDGRDLPWEKHPSMIAVRKGSAVKNFVMGVYNPKNNSHRWILIDASPQFRPGETSPYQAYTIFEDITERREYEIKLRISEEKFQKAFNNSPDAILISDLEQGLIQDVNKGAIEMLGFRKQQILNKSLMEAGILQNPKVKASIEKKLEKNERVSNYETIIETSNGQVLNTLISADILYLSTRKYILTIIRDVTDLKRAEERLIGSVLEGSDQERRRISEELHDSLGQTLTASLLSFEKYRSKPEKKNLHFFENGLNLLNRSIQESREIIKDLMPRAIADFGLTIALESLLHHLRKSSGIKFGFYYKFSEDDLDEKMQQNIYRITQEISHNIIRHSKASEATLQIIAHEDKMIYTFEDNGTGIKDIESLEETKGLGFKNMKNRVKSLGGSFEVESAEGKGTLVYIEIPFKHDTNYR